MKALTCFQQVSGLYLTSSFQCHQNQNSLIVPKEMMYIMCYVIVDKLNQFPSSAWQ